MRRKGRVEAGRLGSCRGIRRHRNQEAKGGRSGKEAYISDLVWLKRNGIDGKREAPLRLALQDQVQSQVRRERYDGCGARYSKMHIVL